MTTETIDGIESAVAEACVATRADPYGGVILVKNDLADCAYVIVSGRVEIRETGRVLESIGPNELFGEVGMIDGGSRSASAVAVDATEVRVIDRSTFDHLLRESPDFVMAIMRDMARRLRAMNANQRPATGLPLVPSRLEKRTAG